MLIFSIINSHQFTICWTTVLISSADESWSNRIRQVWGEKQKSLLQPRLLSFLHDGGNTAELSTHFHPSTSYLIDVNAQAACLFGHDVPVVSNPQCEISRFYVSSRLRARLVRSEVCESHFNCHENKTLKKKLRSRFYQSLKLVASGMYICG